MTASDLLALAHGKPTGGVECCFFCGASCGDEYLSSTFVKDSFVDWGIVAFANSRFVCTGCVLALDEKIPMPGRDKPQKFRSYSWLLADGQAIPLTKADLTRMRECCLSPPAPPWALALATSGQKHLLYRTPINLSRKDCSVQLESETVHYSVRDLADRLRLCGRIAAATGKPALSATWTAGTYFALSDYWPDDYQSLADDWQRVASEPLSRLAIFLCPNKEDSCRDYPSPAIAI